MESADNKFLQTKAIHYRKLYGRWIFDYENCSRYIKAVYGGDSREEKLRRRNLVLFGELQVLVYGWMIYDFSFQSKHINPEIPLFLFNPMAGQGRSMIDPQLKGEMEDMFAEARKRYGTPSVAG